MQLEDLQRHWQHLDEKLERTLTMDRELLRLTLGQSVRDRVNYGAIWPVLDIVFCLVVLLLTGSCLANHWQAWSFVAPAVVVMLACILLLIDSIRQLHGISEIDWAGSVVEIQGSLARLHLAKVRQLKWVLLLSPLVGFCGLIVALQWLLDRLPEPPFLLDKLNSWWVASNYVFGLLFIPFGHLMVGFLAQRFGNRLWWQRAQANLSGKSLSKAREELEHWARLET